MSDDFLAQAKRAFEFLTGEPGYRLVRAADGTSFDNASLFYESARMWIAVVRDRGQVSFTLGSMHGPGQYDQEIVQLLVEGAVHYPHNPRRPAWTLLETETLLRRSLARIEELFSSERFSVTRAKARALEQERAHVLFDQREVRGGAV